MSKQKLDSIERLARFTAEEFVAAGTRLDKLDRQGGPGIHQMGAGLPAPV